MSPRDAFINNPAAAVEIDSGRTAASLNDMSSGILDVVAAVKMGYS